VGCVTDVSLYCSYWLLKFNDYLFSRATLCRSFVGFLPLEFSNLRQERVTCAKIALVDLLPEQDKYPAIGMARIRPDRQLSYVFRGQKLINDIYLYVASVRIGRMLRDKHNLFEL
jgi:hypothetical protein